jgi:hydrogenase nickel incorporation protein HypA/HybF
MHELSIALSILDIASSEAVRQGDPRVRAIHVKLGQLSGVVKEALLAAYEFARTDSRFSDSQLVIEDVPILLYCETCNADRLAVSLQSLRCMECGTPSDQVVQGRELELAALEIDE